jgi:hypothetical protein
MSYFNDTIEFRKAVSFAASTGLRLVQTLEVPFVLADITAGTKASSALPANALILGCHVEMTTALGFSAGTTTGVSAQVGNVDADGFGTSVALAGAAGYRRPAPGVLNGAVVAGGVGGLIVTFTATGGTPSLAEVSAGAGKAVIHFVAV